jgi:hypothetical protein
MRPRTVPENPAWPIFDWPLLWCAMRQAGFLFRNCVRAVLSSFLFLIQGWPTKDKRQKTRIGHSLDRNQKKEERYFSVTCTLYTSWLMNHEYFLARMEQSEQKSTAATYSLMTFPPLISYFLFLFNMSVGREWSKNCSGCCLFLN